MTGGRFGSLQELRPPQCRAEADAVTFVVGLGPTDISKDCHRRCVQTVEAQDTRTTFPEETLGEVSLSTIDCDRRRFAVDPAEAVCPSERD